jgi:hypothetical protein
MWSTFQKHEGVDDSDVLCWSGTSLEMNPWLPADEIEAAMAEDPIAARAEYLGLWRDDINSLFDPVWLDVAVDAGVYERPRQSANHYSGYVDVSGGRRDSFALGIAHKSEDGTTVLDCVREVRPPCEPQQVVAEFSGVLKSYGVWSVIGDKYSAEWCVEAFRQHGIAYKSAESTTSDLLLESVGAFSARKVRLLDHARLKAQLLGLERRSRSGGRDTAGHAPAGHDDLAVAAVGALLAAAEGPAISPPMAVRSEPIVWDPATIFTSPPRRFGPPSKVYTPPPSAVAEGMRQQIALYESELATADGNDRKRTRLTRQIGQMREKLAQIEGGAAA